MEAARPSLLRPQSAVALHATGPEAWQGCSAAHRQSFPRATVQHMQRRLGSSSIRQLSGQRHPDTIWGLEVQFLTTPQLHTLSFGKSSMSLLLAGHSRCLFSNSPNKESKKFFNSRSQKVLFRGMVISSFSSHLVVVANGGGKSKYRTVEARI